MVRIPALNNAREWAEHHSTLKEFYLLCACKAAGISGEEAEARRPGRVPRSAVLCHAEALLAAVRHLITNAN